MKGKALARPECTTSVQIKREKREILNFGIHQINTYGDKMIYLLLSKQKLILSTNIKKFTLKAEKQYRKTAYKMPLGVEN